MCECEQAQHLPSALTVSWQKESKLRRKKRSKNERKKERKKERKHVCWTCLPFLGIAMDRISAFDHPHAN
jgi:hypothetical protein